MLGLLKGRPALRRFFFAFLQSQVGTGAAVVALPLVAYQRLHSSWAISLVLLGEFLPGIVLAPVFGSIADRCSRRRLAVAADVFRAGCFLALALSSSYALILLLALLSGVGSALFRPTINAALPGLSEPEERSRVTALFCGCANAGLMLGPALAGGLLLVTSAHGVLMLDAATFAVSAALLSGVDLGPRRGETSREEETASEDSLLGQTRAGMRAAAQTPGLSLVLIIASLVVLTGAMFNVIAPLLATGPLHAGGAGYSLLMALYGAGTLLGSALIARGDLDIGGLRRRWALGIALSGLTMAAAALAPNLTTAMVAFLFIGVGETLLVGPEMRLVQELAAESVLGRVFGLKDVLDDVAFALAFLCAGALATVLGVRITFVGAGLLTLALAALARPGPLRRPRLAPLQRRPRLPLLSRSPTAQ